MKRSIRKYVLILLTLLTTLLCTVGVSTWIILSKQEVSTPSGFTKISTTVTTISVDRANAIYYGQNLDKSKISLTITDANGVDVTSCFDFTYNSTSSLKANSTAKDTLAANTTVTFTPKAAYQYSYNTPSPQTLSVPINAVAAYKSSSATTYYSTLDDALAAANTTGSGTVYSLPLGNTADTGLAKLAKTIQTTTEIKSGVTLSLPYDESKLDTATEYITTPSDLVTKKNTSSDGKDSARWTKSAFGMTNYRANQIFVKANHTLTNNGTIIIAGQISGGDAMNSLNSMTAGYHSQINLNAGSTLNNGSVSGSSRVSGNITCYGYINDLSTNGATQGTAHVNSVAGEIDTVFSVVEHRGGSFYFGMILTDPTDPTKINTSVKSEIEAKLLEGVSGTSNYTPSTLLCPPFNRFYIESINSKLTISYYTSVIGHTDLYADNQHNTTDLSLIGTTNESIIQLTNSNSVIENTFNPTKKVHTLNVFGDMTLNPFKLTLNITKTKSSITISVNIHFSTSNVYFPISHYFNVTLNPFKDNSTANVDLTKQKLKLLAGSNLTVAKGVNVTADSIAVYKQADSAKLNKVGNVSQYYDTAQPDAILNVNGSLTATSLGGNVQTTGSGAVLNMTRNSLISKEMNYQGAKSTTTVTVKVLIEVSEDLPYFPVGYYSDADSTKTTQGNTLTTNNATLNSNRTYYSSNGKWYPTDFTVTLDTQGGTNGRTINVADEIAENLGANGGFVVTLPQTERTHYTFSHWCTNKNCTNGNNCTNKFVSGTEVFEKITIYAHGIPNDYTLKYGYILPDGTITESGIADETFNVESTISPTTTPPTDENGNAYNFDGWYDADGNKLESLAALILANSALANGGTVTIYAKWTSNVVYTVFFENSHNAANGGYDIISKTSVEEVENLVFTPPTTATDLTTLLTTKNENTNEKMYFDGWYIDSEFTTRYEDWDQLKALVSEEDETYERTLYARWIEKYELTLTGNSGVTDNLITVNEVLYLNDTQLPYTSLTSSFVTKEGVNVNKYDKNLDETKYFKNWTIGSTAISSTGITSTDFTNKKLTVTANWATKYVVKISVVTGDKGADGSLTAGSAGKTPSITIKLSETSGGTAYFTSGTINTQTTVSYNIIPNHWVNISGSDMSSGSGNHQVTANNQTITVKGTKGADGTSCVTPDTLVTLADGTQKEIQYVTHQDMLLVWDFYKGEYTAMPSSIVMNHGYDKYTVVTLVFEDGTVVKTINGHGFFDKDENAFVIIDENNVAKYVGHNFVKQDVSKTVKLVSYSISEEYTESWSILTVGHYNCILEGLLTLTPAEVEDSNKYLMPFELGEDMKYDEEKMQADIQKYGLYSYEDFKEYMTYEQFAALNLSIFKVSVAKGYITWEEILYLISIHIK